MRRPRADIALPLSPRPALAGSRLESCLKNAAQSPALSPRTSPWPRAVRVWLGLLVLVLAAPGCDRSKSEADGPPLVGEGTKLAAAGDQAYSPDQHVADDDDDKDDKDDDENQDYWKGIKFDIHNFEEVTDYVTTYYIDEKVEKKRAWIAAANGALGLLEPSGELLPASFMTARRGHKDEEGRLDGDFAPYACGGKPLPGVVLHRVPGLGYLKYKRSDRPDRRLTDEEILELRAKGKARYRIYREGWDKLAFGRKEFLCVMAFVKAELVKDQAKRKARRAAAAKTQAAAGKGAKGDKAEGKDTKGKGAAAAKTGDAETGGAKTGVAKSGDASKAKSAKAAEAKKKAKKKKKKKKKGPPPALYAPLPDEDAMRNWDPDINRAWLAASSAFLYALDPHSAVIPRKQWDESTRKTQDSSFEGIGAVLTQRQDRTIVENPMEELPAWKAGVRAGDQIIKVDGVDIRGWLLGKVVKKIRGKKHTIVTLTVAREGDPKPIDIAIKRDHIPIKNVTGKLLKHHPGVAHVKMSGFVPRSAQDLRAKVLELQAKAPGGKLKGLILDLRRNSGGLLNRAIDVADMFLDRGVVVTVKSRRRMRRGGGPEVHKASADDDDFKFPLIVLVNDGSASASEIVASAIQENGRGLVAGQRTFGKASVQTLFEPALHLDYYIKLTVARYYAPSGRTIQVTGVHPDIPIAPKADGKAHVGFREENLTNHLEPIDPPGKSPMAAMVPALTKCVARSGKAKGIANRKPKPQILPDYQLLSAADYLLCLARLQSGK